MGLILWASLGWADVPGDPVRGQHVYKKCAACHMVGADARKRVGPVLNDILAAKAGTVEGFKYSKALVQAGEDGLHWTPEALDRFLENPKAMVPKTKMSFRGLKADADRIDVIAYLATFSNGAMAAPVDAGFAVEEAVLALVGDVDYGEYLSSECTTCHQSNGTDAGIPAIVGWETRDFVTAMHAYKTKHRENPVMQMITGRLADDEIAALAVYFKSLAN
ncbi:c-type cytochrome [Algirhabdus cladophorae]|uniref:c-type cytochrome n=1 Tax=Algirhabdus cladophorae TaxID=3377108 RepID=UPI003B846A44